MVAAAAGLPKEDECSNTTANPNGVQNDHINVTVFGVKGHKGHNGHNGHYGHKGNSIDVFDNDLSIVVTTMVTFMSAAKEYKITNP